MPFARCSRSLLALVSTPLIVACGYGDHMSHHYDSGGYSPGPAPSTQIEQSTIDVDQLLDIEPAAGAGAFLEYETGGTYHLTTSCDVGGGACYWDVVVTPLDGAPLLNATPVHLESDDSVTLGSGNQLRFVAYTSRDLDGVTFQTDPGATIEVDALLDNAPANRYLFWVGDGALHSGAPSNPVDLVPSAE